MCAAGELKQKHAKALTKPASAEHAELTPAARDAYRTSRAVFPVAGISLYIYIHIHIYIYIYIYIIIYIYIYIYI
jgi:hypothetical protein